MRRSHDRERKHTRLTLVMLCIRNIVDRCIQQSVAVVLFRFFLFFFCFYRDYSTFRNCRHTTNVQLSACIKKPFSRSAEGVSQKTITKTNKQACAEGPKAK